MSPIFYQGGTELKSCTFFLIITALLINIYPVHAKFKPKLWFNMGFEGGYDSNVYDNSSDIADVYSNTELLLRPYMKLGNNTLSWLDYNLGWDISQLNLRVWLLTTGWVTA